MTLTSVPITQWTTLDAAAERDFPITIENVTVYARTTNNGPILTCHVSTMSQVNLLRITKDDSPLLLDMFDFVPLATDATSVVAVRATSAAMDASIDGKNWMTISEGETRRFEGVTTETMVTVRCPMNQGEVCGGVLVVPGTQIDVTKPPTTKTRLGTNPAAILKIRRSSS